MILITLGMSLSLVSAHPGHGDYHPEEVVVPSDSGSSAPVQSSSGGGASHSSSQEFQFWWR